MKAAALWSVQFATLKLIKARHHKSCSAGSQSRTNVSAACHNRNPWARPEGNPNESKHVLRWRRGDVGAAALFPDTLQTRKIMYDIRTTFILLEAVHQCMCWINVTMICWYCHYVCGMFVWKLCWLSPFPVLSTHPPGYACFDARGLSAAYLPPRQWQATAKITYCQHCGSSKSSYSSSDGLVTFFALDETNVKIFAIDHKKTSKQRRKIIGCFGRILRFDDALFLEFYKSRPLFAKVVHTHRGGRSSALLMQMDPVLLSKWRHDFTYNCRYVSGSEIIC